MDMSPPPHSADEPSDVCHVIQSRYRNSTKANHQHICTAIGAISETLKSQSLALSPIAYFAATCNSLASLFLDPDPQSHVVESLIEILSIIMQRGLPEVVVRMKTELVFQVLRSGSVSPSAAAVRCVAFLVGVLEKVTWQEPVCSLYDYILTCATHHSEEDQIQVIQRTLKD